MIVVMITMIMIIEIIITTNAKMVVTVLRL